MGRKSKRQTLMTLAQLDQLIPTLADLFDTERVHAALKRVVTGVRERRSAILQTQNGSSSMLVHVCPREHSFIVLRWCVGACVSAQASTSLSRCQSRR